jgi:L,D-transpeptidase ErfK/SrfK
MPAMCKQKKMAMTLLILLSLQTCRQLPVYCSEFNCTGNVCGELKYHIVRNGESLIELAPLYNVGYEAIVAANQSVNPVLPQNESIVCIPSLWILPDMKQTDGIVINLSEMRLYYFPPDRTGQIVTFPVGIGDFGMETPVGNFRIIEKSVNPVWRVPRSIRQEKPDLQPLVPPGPQNPLGTHAMRLSAHSIMIHGTNRPFGIGRRVSHGCIRLYPEDIKSLYKDVSVGTKVTIIRQPIKVALDADSVLVEVHGSEGDDLSAAARLIIKKMGLDNRVDWNRLAAALKKRSGIPTDVAREPHLTYYNCMHYN